jgi:hypothetical protein
VGNKEIGTVRSRQGILVGFTQHRHDEFTDHALRPFAEVHDPSQQGGVGVHLGMVGSHRSEANAQRLDLLPVVLARGNDGLITSYLQTEGDGDVRMQVAKGAERGQDDALFHRATASVTYFVA